MYISKTVYERIIIYEIVTNYNNIWLDNKSKWHIYTIWLVQNSRTFGKLAKYVIKNINGIYNLCK